MFSGCKDTFFLGWLFDENTFMPKFRTTWFRLSLSSYLGKFWCCSHWQCHCSPWFGLWSYADVCFCCVVAWSRIFKPSPYLSSGSKKWFRLRTRLFWILTFGNRWRIDSQCADVSLAQRLKICITAKIIIAIPRWKCHIPIMLLLHTPPKRMIPVKASSRKVIERRAVVLLLLPNPFRNQCLYQLQCIFMWIIIKTNNMILVHKWNECQRWPVPCPMPCPKKWSLMPDEADKMKERSKAQFIAIFFRIIVRFLVFSLELFKSQKFNLSWGFCLFLNT